MRVEHILRQQAGVISRAQAIAAGLSERQIDRRLATGPWLRLYRGVYLTADRELTDEARVRATWLWAGEAATISGLAAAWWHGLLADAPSIVEVTVPHSQRLRPQPGIRVRRRDLSHTDRVGVRGIWLTALPLTTLEAATAGESMLLDRALQRRVRLDALQRAQSRNTGRRGSAIASRMLITATDCAASEAERTMITLLRKAKITGWQQRYLLGGRELDFAFPAHRLAIEIDGWAWHHDATSFHNDRRRQNGLVLAGWTVLRFTWPDLTQRQAEVIAEVRRALDQAGRRVGCGPDAHLNVRSLRPVRPR